MTSFPLMPTGGGKVTRWMRGGKMKARPELLTAPMKEMKTPMLGMAAHRKTGANTRDLEIYAE